MAVLCLFLSRGTEDSSHAPSCLSMKSDHSMDPLASFKESEFFVDERLHYGCINLHAMLSYK